MAGLIRVLTVVALVFHLSVGCCAHHAHAYENPADSHQDSSPCPDNHHNGEGTSHHESQGCQGERCSATIGSSIAGGSFAQPSLASAMPLHGDGAFLVGIGFERHSIDAGRLLLPVPLHLADQVLLI